MPDLSHTIAYRAVAGAVRNALHGHPDWRVPQSFARSVAKRAAGTLLAHAGPALLAAARQSGQRRLHCGSVVAASGGSALAELRSLSAAHASLTRLIAEAHKGGDQARFIELVTAARIIKREIKRQEAAPTPPAPASIRPA